MKSFPGVGKALAPRLIAALGSRRERYDAAYDIQCLSGIAPVVIRSGKKCVVQYRRACPLFLRQTFHEWAQHSMARCAWAREHYDQQRKAGKGHHTAVCSPVFK
ncbi:MAG: IS110 family transposase [Acidobacteria bacterium]|nr:IS110 family transposase [Acidobacteriota bacterium]